MKTKIPYFRRFVIQNFPFIENDFDALTDYQLISKIVEYLNKVIKQTNINSEAVQQLQTYVEHYFDNLDVQEEINNKLDAMAESGELTELISEYLNLKSQLCFDNVADMKSATNLVDGSFAKTYGYYDVNDGGGAEYKIRTVTVDDNVDEAFLVAISETLVAEMIIKDQVNIKALGAKSMTKDGTKYDIKQYLDKYIAKISERSGVFKLFIPSGVWYSSPCDLTNVKGFDIEGEYYYNNYGVNGTVITTLNDNQQYLLNVGTNVTMNLYTIGWSLKNILLSTYDYTYRDESEEYFVSTPKSVSKCVLNFLYAIQGKADNVLFININGEALRMASCWENQFGYTAFRFVSNPTGDIFSIRGDKTYGANSNFTANEFRSIYFEAVHGYLIGMYQGCAVGNNDFGLINVEPAKFEYSGRTLTYTNADELPNDVNHLAIINLHETGASFTSNTIKAINTNCFPQTYYTYDGNTYVYDTIVKTGDGFEYIGLDITNITNTGGLQPIIVLQNDNTNQIVNANFFHVGNMSTTSSFKFDIDRCFSDLSYNGLCSSSSTTKVRQGGIQKFYKIATQNQGNVMLHWDDDAIFDDKICVEFQRYVTGWMCQTVSEGSKLYVLAKIPENETAIFRYLIVSSNIGINTTLTGTGEWKWYEIDMNGNIDAGDRIAFRLDGSSGSIAYFDSFFFK